MVKIILLKEGVEYENKYGELIVIEKIKNVNEITICFKKYGIRKVIKKDSLLSVKSPYSRSVYNVGYLGEDYYNYKGLSKLKSYERWRNMLKRCYFVCKKHKVYNKNIKVCEEWHNFSNFAKWYEENYYEIEGVRICLDKDIKNKNSFIYSPETCIFVPEPINLIFEKIIKEKNDNNNGLPLGVRWVKKDKIYCCSCRIGNDETIYLGRSYDVEELFNRYVKIKKEHIKEVVEIYKNDMPKEVVSIILSYQFDMND